MFALSIEAASVEEQQQLLGCFEPILHVDRGVQVEENQLEMRGSPVPFSKAPLPVAPEDAEVANAAADSDAGAASAGGLSLRPSPPPRRSDGASPWLLEELERDDGEEEEEEEEDSELVDAADDEQGQRPPLELAQATFLSGHSNSNELLAGSIGFYRYAQPAGAFGLRPPPLRSNVVCIMAVPSWLSSSDLIRFIGGYTRYVRQMRLLRDASMPHRHMLLLQFGSPAIAERFRADYHAKRFNSLEPEVAAPVHVAQVVFAPPRPPNEGGSGSASSRARAPAPAPQVHMRLHVMPSARPLQIEGHWGGGGSGDALTVCGECEPAEGAASSAMVASASASASAQPAVRVQLWMGALRKRPVVVADPDVPPPPLLPPTSEAAAAVARAERGQRAALPPLDDGALLGTAVELPSCPVCLERLDPSISGIVTIVCDHTFHCECLRRWADSSCPVCRHVSDDSQSSTACEVCGTTESLWICLVCGHVGCGRYSGCGSSVHHNALTDHNFAMELATQRVWDYKGDNYVHRLIQNKVDGKLVELPDAQQSKGGGSSAADGHGAGGMDEHTRELKLRGQEEQYEAVVHEYSLLLTGQLEVQRRHYEERLADIDRSHKRHLYELEQEIASREDALRRQQEAVERESRTAAKRLQNAQSAVQERDFNKELNEQLMRNQGALRDKLEAGAAREAALAGQVKDLEEQLRDMMFHFESQMKIQQAGGSDELSGGSVIAPEPPPPSRANSKRKGRKS